MTAISDLLDACDDVGHDARRLGVGLLDVDDAPLDGRTVRVGGVPRLNFASCSTLGLELDPRLVEGACSAARRYGTQFSVSRAFLSAPPYAELEERLAEICGGPVLVTPSTTLASAAALPSLVGEKDAVLMDHQVHMTVQLVMPLLQRMGVPVELVRHGRLDRLEERVAALRERHRRVWFLLDGVYSMHGDLAPLEALDLLLARHEQLHLYVDDAHGMSWTGRHGRGHALERLRRRERVVVALSLNKSFGAGGGALVLPDEATCARVRHTAAPLLFSGPVQPPMLGAALASARIHLSPEIDVLQAELRTRIRHANRRAEELGLPILYRGQGVPIRFLALGPRAASTAMAVQLAERGLLTSCALFPAVPAHQTGVRFTLTRHQRLEDVDRLLEEMAAFLPEALARADATREDVDAAFGLAPRPAARALPATALRCEHRDSIEALDATEWDRLLGGRGGFDAGALRGLEQVFGPHQKPENDWRFHYLGVRDASGRPVLTTFFTEAWMKDDMLADARVSREVERRRQGDPYYLTSRALSMGCPLSQGDHLHLDRSAAWRDALRLLVARITSLADEREVEMVALRDLPADDPELDACLVELGFTRFPAPHSLEVEIDWEDREGFLAGLSRRARRFQREEVEPRRGDYRAQVLRAGDPPPPPELWSRLHALYHAVWERSLHLNTFALPEDLLPRLLEHPGWELVVLRRTDGDEPVAFFAARARPAPAPYVPLLVGLDYRHVREGGVYRQCLDRMLERASRLGSRRVLLGMGAEVEKRRFGARPVERSVWVQSRDPFHAEVIALLAADPALRESRR